MRSNTVEAQAAQRARIILLAADGASNRAIGELVGMHYNQVGLWRQRFAADGFAGLLDGDRPGRPPIYLHDDVLLLVKTVTEDPPEEATRWTMAALAERMAEQGVAISPSQAWRICRALDLKPWQVQSWMTSHDPDFWEKAGDVCGLYLDRRRTHWCGRWMRRQESRPRAASTRLGQQCRPPAMATRPGRASPCAASSSTAATAR